MRSYRKYLDIITRSIKDKADNNSILLILFKLSYWIIKCRGGFSYFFLLNLHKKGNSIKQILDTREFAAIHKKLNPIHYMLLLEDKYVFDRFMKSYNYPLAEMIGLLENKKIYWLQENRTELIDNIINYNIDCYLKMHLNWGGNEVYKLEIKDKILKINNISSDIMHLKLIASKGIFVLQKTIYQHPEINRLNNSCVNTLRMITIHNGESAENLGNFIRIGTGSSIVDNIAQGGLGCGIHEDGTLYETALDLSSGNIWITHHPTTCIEFKSIKIPFYKQTLDLVIKMHNSFHCFFTIAWDIAITESGPIVIEGNPLSDLIFEQSIYGGIRSRYLNYAKSYETKKGTFLSQL